MPESMLVSEELRREIRDFLIEEAELLDTGRFREWLDHVTDDMRYFVPVRVTRERAAPTDIVAGAFHMDDDHDALEMRVLRLETEYAWAEDPPSRTRHFVTNLRVCATERDGELRVKSNLLLYRTRGDVPKFDLLSGERHDTLRREDDAWKLASRAVILDQSVILTHNLAVIL